MDGAPLSHGRWRAIVAVCGCRSELLRPRRRGRTDYELDGGGFVRRGNRWQVVEQLRRAREAWAPAERVLARPSTLGNLEAALPILPPPRAPRPLGIDPSVLVERVVQQLEVTTEAVAGAGRDRLVTTVRALLARLLVRRYGLSFNQTARVLGMSKWSVRRAMQRTEAGREPPAVAELLVELERATSSGCGSVQSSSTAPV
jgi:hypothetical protein